MYYITLILQIIGFYSIFCILCSMFSYLGAWFVVVNFRSVTYDILGNDANSWLKYQVDQLDINSEVENNIMNNPYSWKDIIPSTIKEIREDNIIDFFIRTPISAVMVSISLVVVVIYIIQIKYRA